MTRDYRTRLIVILSCVVLALLFYIGREHNQTKSYQDELHRQYVQDTSRIYQQLQRTKQSRLVALDSINRLHISLKVVRDSLQLGEKRLEKIPGKFDLMSNIELQNKMIEEFKRRDD